MASNTKKINSLFTPIIVLVCIALVASFMLAGVYQVTAPVIEAREKETMSKSLSAVLPKGSSFTSISDIEFAEGVIEVYEADNGAGIVCTTNCKSEQGGAIKMMIGVDSFGKITGISVISHNETAGLGDKALAQDYLQNYFDISSSDEVAGVDALSGVTKTSNAIKLSCNAALEEFVIFSKNSNPVAEKTIDEQLAAARAEAFPDVDTFTQIYPSLLENTISVYQAANNKGYVFYLKSNIDPSVSAVVAINSNGEVCYMTSIEDSGDTPIILTVGSELTEGLIQQAKDQYNAIK